MTGLEQKRTGQRPGFTLVELLVVLGVILVLMTLVVAFVPRTMEQQRVTRAASQLQGWLSLAKQWALRDRAPRGVRFTFDATNRITTLNYVEQPDDWWPGTGASMSISTSGNVTTAQLTGGLLDFAGMPFTPTGLPAPAAPPTTPWPVQAGDYLEFSSGSGPPTLGKISTNYSNRNIVNLNIAVTGTVKPSSFTVVRQARVRTGEAPLQLPADTAIDLNPNSFMGSNYASQLPNAVTLPGGVYYFDILFNPYGGVIANGVAGSDIHLWLIDTSLNTTPATSFPTTGPPFDGQELIVTIGLRSGFISVQPPDTNSGDPYSYTRDGKTSGF